MLVHHDGRHLPVLVCDFAIDRGREAQGLVNIALADGRSLRARPTAGPISACGPTGGRL